MQHKAFSPRYLFILIAALLHSALPLHAAQTAPILPSIVIKQAATIDASVGEPFTLAIGESATLEDEDNLIEVELNSLLSDSRCPSDVDCVVAGQAVFMLTVTLNGDVVMDGEPLGQYMDAAPAELTFDRYRLTIADVQPPAPRHDRRLRLKDYRVSLLLELNTPQDQPTEEAPQEIPDDGVVGLGDSFDLRVGESMALSDAAFSVTLRSLSDDSGCFSPDDCSSMSADGSLALVAGEEKELLSFSAGLTPDSPFVYEFAGYDVIITHVERSDAGELVTTFVVTIHAAEPPFDIPAAEPVDDCPYISRYDAMAVLQEDAVTTAIDNFILGPLNENTPELDGLCGYGSIAWTEEKAIDPTQPYLLTSYPSDHLVVAGMLKSSKANELLPLVEASRLANPEGDDMDVLRVQTQLVVGQYEEIIRTIANNAEASESMSSMTVDGIGNEAIWLWQAGNGGYFASVLARSNDKFALVSALVGEQTSESTVRDYMVLIARRILQPQQTTSTPKDPGEAQPTPTPGLPANPNCDLLSVGDATAILGEEIYEQIVTQDEGCGYVPRTELSPDDPDFSMENTDHGIMIGRLNQQDTIAHLESLINGLGEENPLVDTDIVFEAQAKLAAGDLSGVLELLPDLVSGVEGLEVEILSDVNEQTVAIWGQDNGDSMLSVVMLTPQSEAIVLYASLDSDEIPESSREAVITLFQELAAE